MPYRYPDNIPDYLRDLPVEAQMLFITAFNTVLEGTKDEDKARQAGWGAVKNAYEKTSEGWTRMTDRFRYLSTLLLSEGESITRTQIMRTGTFYHPQFGKFTITERTLESMTLNFGVVRPKAPTEMVVDYDHNLSAAKGTQAAGWIRKLEKDGASLFAVIEWTEEAATHIRSREYRYISPEFSLNYRDKESGRLVGPTLVAAGLTNRPFLEGMEPIMLHEDTEAVLALSEHIILEVYKLMENWTEDKLKEMLGEKPSAEKVTEVKEAVNADEALTPEQKTEILAKIDELVKPKEPAPSVSKPTEAAPKTTEAVQATDRIIDVVDATKAIGTITAAELVLLKATAAEVGPLKAVVDGLTKTIQLSEASNLVNEAIENQKLLPVHRDWATSYCLSDRAGFDAYLKVAPKLGPDMLIRGSDNTGDRFSELTDTELKLAEQLYGRKLTDEDVTALLDAKNNPDNL